MIAHKLSEGLDAALSSKLNEFNSRFHDIFELVKKGYSKDYIRFARIALSNLLGGIG
jgi:hypothetical protein